MHDGDPDSFKMSEVVMTTETDEYGGPALPRDHQGDTQILDRSSVLHTSAMM